MQSACANGCRPNPARWKRNPPSVLINSSMPPRWARPKSPPSNPSPDASSVWNAASILRLKPKSCRPPKARHSRTLLQTSTQTSAQLATSFREYIEQHKAEITALQILYSRPYKQRLTEKMLKELEEKLRDNHAAWTEDNLWNAFAATRPGKVKGRSQAG